VHLISVASSPNADSRLGCFFKVICKRHQMYRKTGKAKKSEATEESKENAPVSLHLPGIKLVAPLRPTLLVASRAS
jgi:hypothetical protein